MKRHFWVVAVVLTGFILTLGPLACGEADEKKEDKKVDAKDEPKTVTTDSGLKYQELKVGTGDEAKKGKMVTVRYTGWLTTGKKFDSGTIDFKLGAGKVIKGWDEGVAGVKVGGKRKLTIPSALGYGKTGFPPDIPPDATLIFEVELLEVK